jgi:hypothetical protein
VETGHLIKACAAAYTALALLDLARTRRAGRFAWELLPLILLVFMSVVLASAQNGYVSFGAGASPVLAVAIMFGAILLGIAARYIFYLQGQFAWLDFVKPLCISPILLLPLMSSVQTLKMLDRVQVLSFALLAFQNGFFWQAVLQRAHPQSNSRRDTLAVKKKV